MKKIKTLRQSSKKETGAKISRSATIRANMYAVIKTSDYHRFLVFHHLPGFVTYDNKIVFLQYMINLHTLVFATLSLGRKKRAMYYPISK